jgi:hypothetical protein
VHFDYFNTQGQQKFVWPPSFALSGAYVDQLERAQGLSASRIAEVRDALKAAEGASGARRQEMLGALGAQLTSEAKASTDSEKVERLSASVRALAGTQQ